MTKAKARVYERSNAVLVYEGATSLSEEDWLQFERLDGKVYVDSNNEIELNQEQVADLVRWLEEEEDR